MGLTRGVTRNDYDGLQAVVAYVKRGACGATRFCITIVGFTQESTSPETKKGARKRPFPLDDT